MDDYTDFGIDDPGSINYGGSALGSDQAWDQIQSAPDSSVIDSIGDSFGGDTGVYDTGDQNIGSPGALTAIAGQEKDLGGMDKLSAAAAKADTRDGFQKLFNLKTGSDGSTDWADPKNIDKLVKIGLGLGNLLGSRKQSGTASGAQQAASVQAQLQQQLRNAWTPQQAAWANSFFQTPVSQGRGVQQASEMRSPIVQSRGYADGGKVSRGFGGYGDPAAAEDSGPLMPVHMNEDIFNRTRRRREEIAGLQDPRAELMQRGTDRVLPTKMLPITDLLRSLPELFKSLGFSESPAQAYPPGYAAGGEVGGEQLGALSAAAPFVGYVEGDSPGQADLIDARLSAGEYVFDADTVAALGDGNNAAGAKVLDQMREEIRGMKRGAPAGEIPPALHGMEE